VLFLSFRFCVLSVSISANKKTVLFQGRFDRGTTSVPACQNTQALADNGLCRKQLAKKSGSPFQLESDTLHALLQPFHQPAALCCSAIAGRVFLIAFVYRACLIINCLFKVNSRI
jgi:hypothetical protein